MDNDDLDLSHLLRPAATPEGGAARARRTVTRRRRARSLGAATLALSLLVGAAVITTDDPPDASTVIAGEPEGGAAKGFDPAGQLLVRRHVPDEDPLWLYVDPETGEEHPVPVPPDPDAQGRPSYIARSGALVAVTRGQSELATVWVLPTGPPGRWRRVGTAEQVIRSEGARGLWLADAERDSEGKQVGMRVREIDVLRGPTSIDVRLPCCHLSAHVLAWLVFYTEDEVLEWDLGRGRVRRDASQGVRLASARTNANAAVLRGPCESDGRTLLIEDRASGGSRAIGEPCRYSGPLGFSPDDKTLAAWRLHDGAAAELMLIDVESGRETAASLSITDAYSFSWGSNGRIYYVDADYSTIRWFELSGDRQETGTIPTEADLFLLTGLELVPPSGERGT